MGIINTIIQHKLKSVIYVLLFLTFLMIVFMYTNKVAPVSWGLYGNTHTQNGIALQGADTVAYYTNGVYTPGDSAIFSSFNDATWYFATEKNKQLFIATPGKYIPQYGGYCAFAVSKNVTANASPEFWTIQNNKLYIFNADSVKQEWLDGLNAGSMTRSDSNWATRM